MFSKPFIANSFRSLNSNFEKMSDTDSDINEAAAEAMEQLLPKKSKATYEKAFKRFENWCCKKNVKEVSEKVMLAYLNTELKDLKASTVWSNFSMIKSYLQTHRNINISNYQHVLSYLKRKMENYQAKKSKILERNEIYRFLKEANNDRYLVTKVIV